MGPHTIKYNLPGARLTRALCHCRASLEAPWSIRHTASPFISSPASGHGGQSTACAIIAIAPGLVALVLSGTLTAGRGMQPAAVQPCAGRVDVGGEVTARDIIIATGSVPFVPPGIPIDGKTVFTSDHALKLEWVPNWVAIIGSGYIGLEFSDVYTALGSEVTFIEVHPRHILCISDSTGYPAPSKP